MDTKIPEIIRRHSDFCSIFANPRRLMIMKCLFDGEKTVGAIATEIGMPDYNISQHLRIMKDRGAVRQRKEGREVYYRCANPKFIEACKMIRDGLIETYAEMNIAMSAEDL
ncbi:MAG TPA: metalloregulator ArsR/SmtB family transcription factor [bacterium]